MAEVTIVAESRELEPMRVVADHPVQETDGRSHHLRIIRVIEDALVGGLEELPLTPSVIASGKSLPGREQIAEIVHAVRRLHAFPPVGAWRGGGRRVAMNSRCRA